MKIEKYKLFLEKEGIRDDEHSHLNDSINKKDGLKNQFLNDDAYDLNYGEDGEDDLSEDEMSEDDMDHLLYLLRSLFKNVGVEADVSNKNLDIIIYVILNKKEKISNIIKVLDVAAKLKKDILPQYDSEFELWETKTGEPMMTFNFFYEGSDGDPNFDGTMPF